MATSKEIALKVAKELQRVVATPEPQRTQQYGTEGPKLLAERLVTILEMEW